MTDISGIRVYSWNARLPIADIPVVRRLRLGPRANNFGDMLGPLVVERVLEQDVDLGGEIAARAGARLFSIGSVLHFARSGDTVWGTGVNGKVARDEHRWSDLDVRAVRGPRTRRWIEKFTGHAVPEIYGDPALLLFELGWPRPARRVTRHRTVIPNLNDLASWRDHEDLVSPRAPLDEILRAIASSEAVLTSSLHALVLAELLDVPVALIRSSRESPFKYLDYIEGTGRVDLPMFDDMTAAAKHLATSPYSPESPLSGWDSTPLRAAFPRDLWVDLD